MYIAQHSLLPNQCLHPLCNVKSDWYDYATAAVHATASSNGIDAVCLQLGLSIAMFEMHIEQ